MATLTRRRSRLETHLKEDGNLVLNMKTGVVRHVGYHDETCDPSDCECTLDSFKVGRFAMFDHEVGEELTHLLVGEDRESFYRLGNVFEDERKEWLR